MTSKQDIQNKQNSTAFEQLEPKLSLAEDYAVALYRIALALEGIQAELAYRNNTPDKE